MLLFRARGGDLSLQYRSGGLHKVTWNSTSSLSFIASSEVANKAFPYVYFTPTEREAAVTVSASREDETSSIDLSFNVDSSSNVIQIDVPSSVVIEEDTPRVIDFCTFTSDESETRFDAVAQVDSGSFLLTSQDLDITLDETMSIVSIKNKTIEELQSTMHTLTYVPEENFHSSSTIHSVIFTISSSATTAETQIFVQSVNDVPTIEMNVEEITVTAGRRIHLNDAFVIRDADFTLYDQSEDSLRVTVKTQHGTLALMSSNLNIVTGLPNGEFRVAGSPESINEALAMLTYTYDDDESEDGVLDMLDIQVQDHEDATAHNQLRIQVLSSRSGPRFVNTIQETVQLQEQVSEILHVADIISSDEEEFTLVELTVRAAYGVVTVPTFKQMQFFQGDGEQDGEMRFVASTDATNRVLSHLTYVLKDSPTSSSSHVEDTLEIEMRAVDKTTKVALSNEILDSIRIQINVSRSVPELTTIASLEIPSSAWTLSTDEDEILELTQVDLREIFGNDAYDLYERVNSVTLELETDLGLFRVPTSTPHSSMDRTMCVQVVPSRDFETYEEHTVNSFRVTGTMSAVQNSMSRASYFASTNVHGTAHVAMKLSHGDDATISRSITFEIRSVNDAPSWGHIEEEEDVDLGCNESKVLLGLSVHDIEAEAESSIVSVTLSAARGTIRVVSSSSSIRYVVGDGNSAHQLLRFMGLVDDINQVLNHGIEYVAPSTASSLGDFDEVVFRVDDMGSSGQGGSQHAERSVLIRIEAPIRDVRIESTFEGIRYVENALIENTIPIDSSVTIETESTFGLLAVAVSNGDLNEHDTSGLSCAFQSVEQVKSAFGIVVEEHDLYCAGSIEKLVSMIEYMSCSPHNMDSIVEVKFTVFVEDGTRWHVDSATSRFSLYPNEQVLPRIHHIDDHIEILEDEAFELSRLEFQGDVVRPLLVRVRVLGEGGSLSCSSVECPSGTASTREILEETSLSSLNLALSSLKYVPNANANSFDGENNTFALSILVAMQRNESNSRLETVRFTVLPSNDPPVITLLSSNVEVHSSESISVEGIEIYDEEKHEMQHLTLSVSSGTIHLERMFGLRLVEETETSVQVVGTAEVLTSALESLRYVSSSSSVIHEDVLEIHVEDESGTRTSRSCTIQVTPKPKQPVLRVPDTILRLPESNQLTGIKIEYDDVDVGLTVCASEGCVMRTNDAEEEECCVVVEDRTENLNTLLRDSILYLRNKNESYDDEIRVKLEYRDEVENALVTTESVYKLHVSAVSIQRAPEMTVPDIVEKSMHDAFEGVTLLATHPLKVYDDDDESTFELEIELQGHGFVSIEKIVPGIQIETEDLSKAKQIHLKGTSTRLNSALGSLTYKLESDLSETFVKDMLVWTFKENDVVLLSDTTTLSISRECRRVTLTSKRNQDAVLDTEHSIANIGSTVSLRVDNGRPCGNRTILEMIWKSSHGRVFVDHTSFDQNCLVHGSGTTQLRLRCSLIDNVESEVVQHVKYELETLLPVQSRVDVVTLTAQFRDFRDLNVTDSNIDDAATLSVPVFVSPSSRSLIWSVSESLITGLEDVPMLLSSGLRLSPVQDLDVFIRFTIRVEHGFLRLASAPSTITDLSGDGTTEITFEASSKSFAYDDENDGLIFDDIVEFVPSENWAGETSVHLHAGSGSDSNRLEDTETSLFVLVAETNDAPSIVSWCDFGTIMLVDSQVNG
eukprot:g6719.t1